MNNTKMRKYQALIKSWAVTCFGETTAVDVAERNWRFLEEALELVQSLGGNADDAHKLVDYVFGRDKGEPSQEVGGTMVTLAALCAANNIDMNDAAVKEYERISSPEMMDKILRKNLSKPKQSPLPGAYEEDYGKKWGEWIDWDGKDHLGPDEIWEMDDGYSFEWVVNVVRRGPNPEGSLCGEAHHMGEWEHTCGPEDILKFRIEQI